MRAPRPVALLVALALTGCQSLILRVTSIRPFVEERFAGWVEMGLPAGELDGVLRRIYNPKGDGPGSWTYELAEVAADYEQKARRAPSPEEAAPLWRSAAAYYAVARFPYLATPAKRAAYDRHIACYLELAESFDPPLEVVEIPFEGKTIIGYLRVPSAPEPPPVVVLTGGVDTWKSDIDTAVEPLLQQGLAVFAMDIPGTGESQWRLAWQNDKVFDAVFTYLQQREEVDGERLGLYQISFGGYFAMRLGLTRPAVKAVVNVGGPLAHAFSRDHIAGLPDVMVATIAHAMEASPNLPVDEMMKAIDGYSLDAPGYLQSPKQVPPILAINGSEDELVPIADLYIVSRRGIPQEEIVYDGEAHCAMDHMSDWAEKAARWLRAEL